LSDFNLLATIVSYLSLVFIFFFFGTIKGFASMILPETSLLFNFVFVFILLASSTLISLLVLLGVDRLLDR